MAIGHPRRPQPLAGKPLGTPVMPEACNEETNISIPKPQLVLNLREFSGFTDNDRFGFEETVYHGANACLFSNNDPMTFTGHL